ncbi:MAG TPA: phosphoadenylyl-sulfate reductase [Candidatus Micrarchaeaceae archaeon]|nr:phosphoadenylyl-sulfate reductase [Candidatus Micrarchaeaceae archaeon]
MNSIREMGMSLAEMAEVSRTLEAAGAVETIRWTVAKFGAGVALACSFQDCVIVDLAVAIDPGLEVVFLDTEFHFPETLAFVEAVRERYRLNLTVTHPDGSADPWPCGSVQCCQRRKVEPLFRALEGKSAWLTGLKRSDAATRSHTRVVAWDEARQMIKVNPLAAWTDDDIAAYIAAHDLPIHPLFAQGYLSIGCAPTTRRVMPGEDPRAGRWSESDQTECGLHS